VKFLARWLADGLAIYLALYLLDSVLGPRLHLAAAYPAILAGVFLGVGNAFVKPLYRAAERPLQAVLVTCVVVLLNLLFLHLFVWAGHGITTTHFGWVLAAAALITLLSGTCNWLIGFRAKEKPRPATGLNARRRTTRDREGAGAGSARRVR
jgi:uncharacterized membrane protein YvlD (DUF360 family)